jgi:ATP-dependent Lon protease
MSEPDDFLFCDSQFSGVVRLFPLPNVVLFPQVMQPLQIFEPRYLDMLDDALADDRLFAMALLQPGWEADYEGRPPVASTVCLGRILSHQPTDDGRQNVLLVGLRRARILSELGPRHRYREASALLLKDNCPPQTAGARASLQRELLDLFRKTLPQLAGESHAFDAMLAGDLPLGMLTDILTYMLPFDIGFKQSMLSQLNVERRARRLLKKLTSKREGRSDPPRLDPFPPEFSRN